MSGGSQQNLKELKVFKYRDFKGQNGHNLEKRGSKNGRNNKLA